MNLGRSCPEVEFAPPVEQSLCGYWHRGVDTCAFPTLEVLGRFNEYLGVN